MTQLQEKEKNVKIKNKKLEANGGRKERRRILLLLPFQRLMIFLNEMENNRNNISFDLLGLMECQDAILKNQEKKKKKKENSLWNTINKKKNPKKNVITNTIKNNITNTPTTVLTPNNRKRKKKLLDLNYNEKEYKGFKNCSVKNEENEKNDKNGDNFMIPTKNIICTRSNKKRIKEKICSKLINDEEPPMKREHKCDDDFNKEEYNETEENKQIEETVKVMNKLDDILYTNYKKYYKNCPNCKLYLKELTKRVFLDFLTVNEHINQNEQNLVLLRNREIEELKRKNGELASDLNILKNRNLFLTNKIESVSKNIHDLSCQFQNIMEENKILKELNNSLSEKIYKWKTKKHEKENFASTYLGNGIKKQEEERVVDLEEDIEYEKEEEEDNSLDKEIFINVI